MILGNIITSIIQPFANAFGYILAAFYSFTHSYGLSIILLTLTSMLLAFPLTRAGTRSMMRMQLLQPELLKIRNKHKMSPGMGSEERQAARLALNEEMMALYRENGVNPTGGCLPLFLQFPIFIVLYNVIKGMTHQITTPKGKVVLSPEYIPVKSQLHAAVLNSHGKLGFIGLNLADSVRSPGGMLSKIPYIVVILIAVGLQYVSIWQITNRNPNAANANPQMQAVQKFMPLIFLVIYIAFPAGVGLYFIVSSLFRVGQQEYMYKHDPKIVESVAKIRDMKAKEVKVPPTTGKGAKSGGKAADPAAPIDVKAKPTAARSSFRDRLKAAADGFQGGADVNGSDPEPVDDASPVPSTSNGAASKNGAAAAARASAAAVNAQNRSRAKRRRR